MNKIEILAKLLKEDKITVEEFKVLLEPTYVYPYQYYPYITQPTTPQRWDIFYTTCSSNTLAETEHLFNNHNNFNGVV